MNRTPTQNGEVGKFNGRQTVALIPEVEEGAHLWFKASVAMVVYWEGEVPENFNFADLNLDEIEEIEQVICVEQTNELAALLFGVTVDELLYHEDCMIAADFIVKAMQVNDFGQSYWNSQASALLELQIADPLGIIDADVILNAIEGFLEVREDTDDFIDIEEIVSRWLSIA